MAWQPPGRQRNHQNYQDDYNLPNKNQPNMGTASQSGVEVQMEVDTGTRKEKSLPILNELLTALSSIEFLVIPAKQELESLNTKLQDNGGDQELKEKEAILAATVCELEKLRQENGTMIEERYQLKEKIRKHEENIKPLQEKYQEQRTELKRAHQLNENLRVTLDSAKNNLDKVTQESSSVKQMWSKEKDELRERLRKAEAELSDTKSRLSKIMGQKLSDNNPNIADLSDTNRPTKLAERYQELYDNQWTDAFEAFETYYADEKQCITTLLFILRDVKKFCEDLWEKQMQEICNVVRLTKNTTHSSLSDSTKKQLKDFLKGTAEISVPEVQQMYIQKQNAKGVMADVRIQKFINECITICWLMSVQDPPVVLGKDPQTDSAFDTNFFKHYTKTGTDMDYVVWPSLYLHESGPLLGKGVAQAKAGVESHRPSGSSRGTRNREKQEVQVNNKGNAHGLPGYQQSQRARNESHYVTDQSNEVYSKSRHESGNGSHSVPRKRDQDKSSTLDEFTTDNGTSRDNPKINPINWSMGDTKTGARTIQANSGQMFNSQQQLNFSRSTKEPSVLQPMIGTNPALHGQPDPAWSEHKPTNDDIWWFDYYLKHSYNEQQMINTFGWPWYNAFLRYKANLKINTFV